MKKLTTVEEDFRAIGLLVESDAIEEGHGSRTSGRGQGGGVFRQSKSLRKKGFRTDDQKSTGVVKPGARAQHYGERSGRSDTGARTRSLTREEAVDRFHGKHLSEAGRSERGMGPTTKKVLRNQRGAFSYYGDERNFHNNSEKERQRQHADNRGYSPRRSVFGGKGYDADKNQ